MKKFVVEEEEEEEEEDDEKPRLPIEPTLPLVEGLEIVDELLTGLERAISSSLICEDEVSHRYAGLEAERRSIAALLVGPPAQTSNQSVNILLTCVDTTSGLIAISLDDLELELEMLDDIFLAEEKPPSVPMAVEEDKQPVNIDRKSGN